MAYFYIDDGYPESEDYENNYIFFDGESQKCIQKMLQLAQAIAKLPLKQRRKMLEQLLADDNCDDPSQAALANG